MIVIKAAIDCLKVYRLVNQKVLYLGLASELGINEYDEKQVILIRDYDVYLPPGDLYQLQIKPSAIYSPYEVVGAHLKEEDPNVNGELQVLDIEPAYYHTFTVDFVNGRYNLKKGTDQHAQKETAKLFSECLNMTPDQVNEFDLFLNTINEEGNSYGCDVWRAIQEYEETGEKFDKLFKLFKVREWQHVTISQLINFKERLLISAGIDVKKPYRIVGLLSVLFSKEYNARNHNTKIFGATWLYHHNDEFFAPLSSAIALEAYCYPLAVKVPLYAANSSYNEYNKVKQVQLYESGEIILYRDNNPSPVKTGTKQTRQVELKIQLDGNQRLMVSVDTKTYIIP